MDERDYESATRLTYQENQD